MLFQSLLRCLPEPAINIYGTPRKLTCPEKNWYNLHNLQHSLLSYCLTHSRRFINLYWQVDKITDIKMVYCYTNLRCCEPTFDFRVCLCTLNVFIHFMYWRITKLGTISQGCSPGLPRSTASSLTTCRGFELGGKCWHREGMYLSKRTPCGQLGPNS